MTEIVTLGCGGGRHQTLNQTFRTGGFRIHDDLNVHVDPGPGALLLTTELDMSSMDLNEVIVTHSHPDHYTDAEVLVEGMARGSSDGGRFIGSRSTIEGVDDLGPAISKYHKRKAGEIVELEPGDSYEHGDLELEATPTEHTDPSGFGLKIHTEDGIVGYTGDTEYFEDLPEVFSDSRVLIANVTRPEDKRIRAHLCIEDLVKILEEVRPELSIILHMGMLFLRKSPTDQASYVEEKTGVRTVPGFVGTEVGMDGELDVSRRTKQTGITSFS